MRPANIKDDSKDDAEINSGQACGLARGDGASRRFIASVMTISTADDMLADGDVDGGIAAYRKAIEICPPCAERADFQLLLGSILFEQGDAAAAATELRTGYEGGCTYGNEALRRLAFAYAAQGDFTAARQEMAEALEAGEDPAFVIQAQIIFALAVGGLEEALAVATSPADLGNAQTEYRCRLALARAELHRLAGNRAATLAELELVAELARQDALDAEQALWLAVLDRHFGRTESRPCAAAAFAAEPGHWAALAWKILGGDGVRADLEHHLQNMTWTTRAETLAIFDRFTGLAAEAAGNIAAARAAYERARAVPFTQWCIDYHLAGMALQRLG